MKILQTPVFVGRRKEIKLLDSILKVVQSGDGRCVLISGEAGIGKSRFLAEIRDRAEQSGFRSLVGRCFAQDRSFPYAPLVDLLRPFLAQSAVDDGLDTVGHIAPELAKLLSESALPFPLAPAASLPESKLEKRHLFESLTMFFWQRAEAAPLLLAVEDLHWSDQASLEFLLYFVRRIVRKRILLVLTSRIDRTQPELNELLAGLDREPIVDEIRLEPLSMTEVAQLLKGVLTHAQEPSVEFVEAIYSLTEGNPFFAEEICTSLIASGDIYFSENQWRRKPLSQIDIPDSVQRVVQQRLGHISRPARQVADLAAVSGRSFDFAVIQELTGHSDEVLLDLIKELMAARLVVEESADRFAFRHALTREALYGRLLKRERESLHGKVVQAIEKIYAESPRSHLEALAYHACEAELWAKTLSYAQRAGEKALALYAPRAAVEQFDRAITAAGQLSQMPSQTLYRLRGHAYDTMGEFAAARADYEAALRAAEAAADRQVVWQVLLDLALLWASRDYARTGDYCRQALALARAMEDEAAIAHSLNRLGNWLMNSGRPFKALEQHREALSLFERLHDRAGIAATLDLLAMTSNQSGDVGGTVTYYERAIPILRELQEKRTLSSSLANLALYTLGEEDARAAVKLAQDISWQPGEAYALNCLAVVLFNRSRYGESLAIRSQSLALAEAIEHPQWTASNHVFFGYSYKELLALDRAEAHLVKGLALARQVGSSFFIWMGSGMLASVYIGQKRLEEAEALLADLPLEWIPSLLSVRLARIELADARQDAKRVLQLLDEIPAVPIVTNAAPGMLSFVQAPAQKLRAQALLWLDRLDEAEQTLQQTIGQYAKHDLTHGLWQIYLALGKIYLARSSQEQAREMFKVAREQIDMLAPTIDEEALRENFTRRAMARIPKMQPLSPRQAAKREYGGLTRREREVAAVVAQGTTNQEIADELVVSVKTVEAHITRILSKLGFSSRTQIATWAVEKGLASAPQDLDTLSRSS